MKSQSGHPSWGCIPRELEDGGVGLEVPIQLSLSHSSLFPDSLVTVLWMSFDCHVKDLSLPVSQSRSMSLTLAPSLTLTHDLSEEVSREVDIRLHEKGSSKLPWRKAGHPKHLVDVVDSDQ